MNSERREFIKKSCSLCASIFSIGLVLPALQSCSTLLTMKTNISKGSILVLRTNFSSENKIVIIKNAPFEFDIALVQLGIDEFKAFELQCTHQSNALVPTKNGFFCNAHGSSFSLEGKVKNAPALKPLIEYKIEVTEDTVMILI